MQKIAEALSTADAANTAIYAQNAERTIQDLDELSIQVKAQMAPLAKAGFVVFHDAYQYFETSFGLVAAGAISINPEVMPGAERLSEIRALIEQDAVTCVFAEPQFKARIVQTIIAGTGAKSVLIDPLGAKLTSGQDLYFDLIRTMATAFSTCLD